MTLRAINLAFRFLLEIAGLVSLGAWGWSQGEGAWKVVLAIAFPVLAAAIWGTFAVPEDPSRSGKAPVVVPGVVRLLLELVFFALAVWSLVVLNNLTLAWVLGGAVVLHYAFSYERLRWLVRQ